MTRASHRPGWPRALLRALARRTRGLHLLRRRSAEAAPAFDLAYIRTGPRGGTPVVVIPGGPGLSVVFPYRSFRRQARERNLELIMIEHRGIGLSRQATDGTDLPPEAMWVDDVVDDIAAVLAQEKINSAVIVGASYGSYLAAGLGVRHPELVAAMILDSPILSTADHRQERQAVRKLLHPSVPTPTGDAVGTLVARGVDPDDLLFAARTVYEAGGQGLLDRFLDQLVAGRARLTWSVLVGALSREATSSVPLPFINEFDLVGTLAFRELDYGAEPDGEPFDPVLAYAALADRYPSFDGEPFDLRQQLREFTWPTIVMAGHNDLRTVPAVAQEVASLLPEGYLVEFDNGHSALESHPLALLQVITWLRADTARKAAVGAGVLEGLPRRGIAAQLPTLISGLLRVDALLGRILPRGRSGRG